MKNKSHNNSIQRTFPAAKERREKPLISVLGGKMKLFILIILLAIPALIIGSCTRKSTQVNIVEGGLYATPKENDNGYNIIKILKIDSDGYHVKMYSNIFQEIPKDINVATLYMAGMDYKKENENLGMGHLPISKTNFKKWKLYFIKKMEIKEEELEGYRMWQEAKGGYW